MGTYSYRARSKGGALVKGDLDAIDLKAARKLVNQRDLTVIEIKEKNNLVDLDAVKRKLHASMNKIKSEEFLIFIQELQTTYAVGIPLLRGLTMIYEQTENPVLREAVAKIMTDVKDGASLTEAFQKQPEVFEPLFVNMVRAGEVAGKLEALLDQAATLIERKNDNRDKVKAALFYPKMVISFMVVVFLVVVYFVIPKMEAFYAKFSGAQLPGITLFVVGLSNFFTTYWYVVFGAFIGGGYFWKWLMSAPSRREKFDALQLKVPILGNLLLQIELYSICTILEILISSGLSIVQALQNVAQTLSNTAIGNAVSKASLKVDQGERISDGFNESKYFPKLFTNLVAIGEESGKLETILNRTGRFYKTQVDYKLANFSKVIEPVLLVFIMGGVLVLALAVFMPIWQSSKLLRPK